MSSIRRPTSRFHPGIAAIYACTGGSPSPLGICGLPPERRTRSPAAWPAALSGFLGIRLAIARFGPGRFPTQPPTATPPSQQTPPATAPTLTAPVLFETPPPPH